MPVPPTSNVVFNPTYLYLIGFILFIVIVVLILVAVNKKKPVVYDEEDEEITRYIKVKEPDYVVSTHMTSERCSCGGKIIVKVFRSGETEKQCIECGNSV
jgi:hypothetical protein